MQSEGFTSNHKNSKLINLESIKELLSSEREKIRIEKNAIVRTEKKDVVNEFQIKEFSVNYDKRKTFQTSQGIGSVPWGSDFKSISQMKDS